MSSRLTDSLKGKPEQNDSGSDAQAQPLSLTSVSDKPKEGSAPAKTEKTDTNAAALSMFSSADSLLRASVTDTPQSKLASMVSINNESQQKFEQRQNASLAGRFTMGAVDNLKGQVEGLKEIAFGKRDPMAELTATLTGKKTGNEHVLINVTKTTLNVGGVVKDLAADTVGLGDGKTSAALGKAIAKAKDDFVNGSAGDRAESLGGATAFVGTLFLGGYSSAKGSANLATDVRAMRTLIQTEKQTAALSEAVTGMKALKTTERVVAATERAVVPHLDDAARLTARTTPVAQSRLATAWSALGTKVENLAGRMAFPGMEPALAGAGGAPVPMGLGRSSLTSFLRGSSDDAARIGKSPVGRISNVGDNLGAKTGTTFGDDLARSGRRFAEPKPTRIDVPAAKPHVAEVPNVKPHVPDAPVAKPHVAEVPTVKPHVPDAPVAKPHVAEVPTVKPYVPDAPVAKPHVAEVPTVKPHVPEVPSAKVKPEGVPATVADDLAAKQPVKPVHIEGGTTARPVEPAGPTAREVKPVKPAAEVKTVKPAAEPVNPAREVVAPVEQKVVKAPGATHVDDARVPAREVKPSAAQADDVKPVQLADDAKPVKPATVVDNVKPAAAADNVKPATVADNVKPATVADDVKPAAAADNVKPATVADDVKPAAAADNVKPVTVADNVKPAAAADNVKPATVADDVKPAAAADNVKPASIADDVKPAAVADNVKPAATADNLKSATAADNVKPAGTADDITSALKPGVQQAERTAAEVSTLKSAENVTRNLATIERNSQVLAQTGDDISREVSKLAPKAGKAAEADVKEIARLSKTLGQGGDDLAVVRQINERVANIAKNGGTEVADDIARTLKPALQKAEATAIETSTLRAVTKLEQNSISLTKTGTTLGDDAARLAADPLKAAAKNDLDEIARLGQNLGKGGDDIATVNKINEHVANISRKLPAEAADDVSRVLKPSIQKAEATVAQNSAIKSATNLEQSIAKVAEKVTGPEAAAIRNNLNALQNATRGFVNNADNAAAHSEDISRALQNLERTAAKTGAADDIARISQETRQLQSTVNASRRVTALETTTKTLASEGRKISDEVARIATKPGAKAVQSDLDEISRLSNNLGKTGDDLETVRKINERLGNVTRAGGADIADDIARNLTPKVQKAEATALEASRIRTTQQVVARVESEAKALSTVTRDLAKTTNTTTAEGRVLQQQLKAIERAADELPVAVNPATDATRLRTMVTAVEKSLPAAERTAIKATVNNLDNAASELTAVRTMGRQTQVIDDAASTLRGTVSKFHDDVAKGTQVIKPGTEQSVQRAIAAVETNTASVTSKLGTTQRIDSEVRALRNAVAELEQAGQTQLARQIAQDVKVIEKGATIRGLEVTSHQGPVLSNALYNQTLATRTIEQVERDLTTLKTWGNIRGNGRLDTINELHENLQMLRFLSKNDARLATYVDDAQQALSKIELATLTRGGRELDVSTSKLLAMAEAGDVQALNKLFIRGLQSDSWTIRSLATNPQLLLGRLGLDRATLAATARVLTRPEFPGLAARSTVDLATTVAGATMLYSGYRYGTQQLLKAIEAQMVPTAGTTSGINNGVIYGRDNASEQRDVERHDAKHFDVDRSDAGQRNVGQQSADQTNFGSATTDSGARTTESGARTQLDRADERRAALDFSPTVSKISRNINFNSVDVSLAARYGFAPDDPEAEAKANSVFNTGKVRPWAALGIVNAVEEVARPNIPTAKTIRIKSSDGTSSDPNSHQKIAVSNFSFTRATALTNQLKLMTNTGENRGGPGKAGTVFGGGPSSTPSLSQNLRTMVSYGSLRPDSAAVARRESTEDNGIDRSSSGTSTPQGPQVLAAATSSPSGMASVVTNTATMTASSSDPDPSNSNADEIHEAV